jgi:hypothetical protein
VLCVLGRLLLHNVHYVVCTGEEPATQCRIYFVYWGGSCYIVYIILCVLGRFLLRSVQYIVCTGEVPAT